MVWLVMVGHYQCGDSLLNCREGHIEAFGQVIVDKESHDVQCSG